jgi:hypothetical protein
MVVNAELVLVMHMHAGKEGHHCALQAGLVSVREKLRSNWHDIIGACMERFAVAEVFLIDEIKSAACS